MLSPKSISAGDGSESDDDSADSSGVRMRGGSMSGKQQTTQSDVPRGEKETVIEDKSLLLTVEKKLPSARAKLPLGREKKEFSVQTKETDINLPKKYPVIKTETKESSSADRIISLIGRRGGSKYVESARPKLDSRLLVSKPVSPKSPVAESAINSLPVNFIPNFTDVEFNGAVYRGYQLEYEYDFDENGALFWIGSKGKTEPFENPHSTGAITAAMSSVYKGEVANVVARDIDKAPNYTNNSPNSYFSIDLGPDRLLLADKYTIRHGASGKGNAMRHWMLQAKMSGSQGEDDWIMLKEHTYDDSIADVANASASWDIAVPRDIPSIGFRQFRIIQTGNNTKGNNCFFCCGLEFYGVLFEKIGDASVHIKTPDLIPTGQDQDSRYLSNDLTDESLPSGGVVQCLKSLIGLDFHACKVKLLNFAHNEEGSVSNLESLVSSTLAFLGLSYAAFAVVNSAGVRFLMNELLVDSTSSLVQVMTHARSYLYKLAYAEALKAGSSPFSRSRLMIVGEGTAGKSSFLRALTSKKVSRDHISTNGVQVDDYSAIREAGMDLNEFTCWKESDKSVTESERAQHQMAVSFSLKPIDKSKNCVTQAWCQYELHIAMSNSDANQFNTSQEENIYNGDRLGGVVDLLSPHVNKIYERIDDTAQSSKYVSIDTKNETAKSLESTSFSDNEADAITFSCWDFGGQRVFQTVQHMFLSRLGVYTVVFDMRKLLVGTVIATPTGESLVTQVTIDESLKYIRFWLRQISMLAIGAPVYFIGTHRDIIQRSADHQCISDMLKISFSESEKDIWKYVKEQDNGLVFFPVSNTSLLDTGSDDDNIVKLRQLFEESVKKDPLGYVNKAFPTSWLKVCDQLRRLLKAGTSYILLMEFEAIADRLGVFESSSSRDETLHSLLDTLHSLGMLVYYNQPGLMDIIVLDPQWIVDSIVSVIRDYDLHPLERDKRVKSRNRFQWNHLRKNGVLTWNMLKVFWSEEADKIDILLLMMKQLKLLCELPNPDPEIEETKYLIPSVLMIDSDPLKQKISSGYIAPRTLLDDQISALKAQCTHTSSLSFPASTFFPEGFLPRLIVEIASKATETTKFVEGSVLIETPSIFLSSSFRLCAALSIKSDIIILQQEKDFISVYLRSSSNSIVDLESVFVALSTACTDIAKQFFNQEKVHFAAFEAIPTSTTPDSLTIASCMSVSLGSTDDETMSTVSSLSTSIESDDDLRMQAELCIWLQNDVKIPSSTHRKNIAKTLFDDGWCTKDTIILIFVNGKLPEERISQMITMSGHRVLILDVLKKEAIVLSEQAKGNQADIDAASQMNGKDDEGVEHSQTCPSSKSRHIMLSYNWDHKPVISALAKHLKSRGIDVWQDISGSSVVGTMDSFSNIDVCMAVAIESSSHGIVCVSRNYTKKPNCIKEFDYLCNRLKYGYIQGILYVMLEKDFTPEYITGPLAVNIGNAFYYELFSEESVEYVSTKISEKLKNTSLLVNTTESIKSATMDPNVSHHSSRSFTDPAVPGDDDSQKCVNLNMNSVVSPVIPNEQSRTTAVSSAAVSEQTKKSDKTSASSFKVEYSQLSRDLIVVGVTATIVITVLTFAWRRRL